MDALNTNSTQSNQNDETPDHLQNPAPVQANGRSIGKLAIAAILLTATAAAGYALYSGACAYDAEEGVRCGETTLRTLTSQLSEKLNVAAEAVKVATQSTLNCINETYTFQRIGNCLSRQFSDAPPFTPPHDASSGHCLAVGMLHCPTN